ncbi:hypothetical protein MPSEU_001052700 [Mayamaea pseudoterrestris]|nr:hypothetical protein MPSEU_001052700 [Mayamaea pseudoterrestris]
MGGNSNKKAKNQGKDQQHPRVSTERTENGANRYASKPLSTATTAAPPTKRTADFYRQEGNAAISNLDYKRALISYRIGLQLLDEQEGITTISNRNESNVNIRIALYSNLAMAYLKLGDYLQAIDTCDAVIALDETNPKVWWRKACAKEGLAASALEQQGEDSNNINAAQNLLYEAANDVQHALQLLPQKELPSAASNKAASVMKRECHTLQHRIQKRLQDLKLPSVPGLALDPESTRLVASSAKMRRHDDEMQGTDQDTADSPNLPLPEQQRLDILRLLEARQKAPPVAGEAFFLVNWRWYCHWCKYTQSDLSPLLPKGAVPPNNYNVNGDNENGRLVRPPGPLDHSQLLLFSDPNISGSQSTFYRHWYRPYYEFLDDEKHDGNKMHDDDDDMGRRPKHLPIRPSLQRGYHYEVLPREVYNAFRCWYGEVDTKLLVSNIKVNAGICLRSDYRSDNQQLGVCLYPLVRKGDLTRKVNGNFAICYACRALITNIRRCTRCVSVQYCSRRCQSSHWEYHKLECTPIVATEQGGCSSGIAFPFSLATAGLKNIGNTCYINAPLQCLLHSTPLTRHFLSGTYREDLNSDHVMRTGGELAISFARVVREMQMNPQLCRNGGYFSPLALRRSVAKFDARFAGSQQQDAQEFLAYLLDGLHEDLNRVKKAPYVEMPDVTDKDDVDIAGARAWAMHKKRNDSLIFDSFYGQFKGTCVCPKCDRVSVSFETFNHVSLELPQRKSRPSFYRLLFFPDPSNSQQAEQPILYGFELFRTQHIGDLMDALSDRVGLPTSRIICCDMRDNTVDDMLDDTKLLGSLPSDTMLAAYEVDPLDRNDCFHVMADHVLLTPSVNGTMRERIGFPIVASFPASYTCRQVWQFMWSRVSNFVPEREPDVLRLVVHSGGTNGAPLNVFPLTLPDGTKMHSGIIPKDLDEPILTFLGEDSVQRFLYIWLEWTGEDNIDENRFIAHQTDASYAQAAERQQANYATNQTVSLNECFDSFQRAERLDEENTWYCSNCREHVQALKTMQLSKLPNILIVHLKRFEYRHMFRSDKLDTFIDFPRDGLDMDRHCTPHKQPSFVDDTVPAEYDLFGVVNHYGRFGFGHYTAHVRRFDESGMSDWVHCDDASIEEVEDPESIVTPAAYVLFYRRRVFT